MLLSSDSLDSQAVFCSNPVENFIATDVAFDSVSAAIVEAFPSDGQASWNLELEGVFGGAAVVAIAAPAVVEQSPEAKPETTAAEVETATVLEAAKLSVSAQTDSISPASQTDGSDTLTQQLTETLKAANGPPAADSTQIHLTPDEVLDLDGGVLVLGSQDVLNGSGTILGELAGNGTIRPGNSPGHITVSTFSPGADAVTEIEIQGTGQGMTYDWIEVTGAATLNGTLKVIFTTPGGYVPALGHTFNVITWGSYTGEFSNWLGTASIPGHSNWALKPTYTATGLSLTIVATPTLAPGVDSAILTGLDTLSDVADFLDGFGELAESIPFIGSNLGTLADSGTAITNGLRNRLTSLLNSLPSAALVTSTIESWNNTAFGGFTFLVKGVLAHYETLSTQPMWWELNLELVPTAVNQTLQNLLGGVFSAAFSGSAPSVSVTGTVVLDFDFGNDSGFFVEVDSVGAKAAVNASGLGGFGFSFNTPAGTQTLSASGGTVQLSASVAATPDESVLTLGRITSSTLTSLANGSIAVGDAFNLSEAGTLHAAFPLTGTLSFLGFTLSGGYVVKVDSDDLMNETPDVTVDVNSTLTLMGQTLSGSFTLKNTGTDTIIKASNVTFNLGAGASRILSVNNGSGTFLLLGTNLAGTMTMDLNLGPAIPNLGLSLTGLTLAFNTSAGSVPTIDDVTVNLPAGPYYRVSGHGSITLTNPQASLNGNFVFEPRDADANTGNGYEEVAVGVANLSFSFTDGTNPLLSVSNGTGAFVFRSTGIVGTATAQASLAVSGLSVDGVFSVTLNDTAVAYNQTVNVNGTTVVVNVPAGPYLRVTATGITTDADTTNDHAELEIMGITLTGDYVFERKQTTTGGERVVTVAASAVSLDLGSTVNDLVSVTNGLGAFIITNSGVAGTATATVTLGVPSLSLSGAFTVRINNTNAAVNETVSVGGSNVTINLPAGPYLQVKGTGVTLGFLGLSLSGNFSFEQRTSQGGSQMITVSADTVSFNFGTNLVTATNGSGFFVITDAGMAGKGSITVGVNAFGAGFSHTFNWSFNTTAGAIDEVFGNPTFLDLPAGPFNQLDSGTPVTISVPIGAYTQSITGRFILTLIDPNNPTIALSTHTSGGVNGATHAIATLNPSGNNNAVRLTTTALGTAANWNDTIFRYVNDSNITDSSATAQWDATAKILTVKVNPGVTTANAVAAAINGVASLPFSASAITDGAGTPGTGTFKWSVATVGVSSLSANIGAGSISLVVGGGSGAFVIHENGMAGEARVTTVSLTGASLVTLTAQDLALRFNNTGTDVGLPVELGDPLTASNSVVVRINDNSADDVYLNFAGPYYRQFLSVAGTAEIGLFTNTIKLGGDFIFERSQIDTNNDAVLENVFKVGVTDLHFELKAGSLSIVSFDHGEGAFVITSAGIAGTAELDFEVGLISMSGNIGLELNTTSAAVTNAQVPTPAGTRTLNLASGNYLQVRVDGNLNVGSISLPFQFLVKISGGNVEFRRVSDNELLVSINSSGTFTLGPPFQVFADFDFAQASPFQWVQLLRQLGEWIESFSDSSLFETEIPFTGGVTLGEAFDWSQVFLDTVYKYMVTVELQSGVMTATTVKNGALSGAILQVQLGDETPVTLTINDTIGSATSRDGNELVDLIKNAITNAVPAGLGSRLTARINKDDQVVIALTEDEIAAGTTLKLVDGDATMAGYGFGTSGTGTTSSPEQTGVLTERYSTEDFFEVIADILNDGVLDNDGGVVYDEHRQVYTYAVNATVTYTTNDLFGTSTVPFNFDLDLGPIGEASVTGELTFTVTLGLHFTIGFDLSASEVPRILSSSLVPVPSSGRLSADAHFGIYLNQEAPNPLGTFGQLFPITLTAASTSGNSSIDHLATDLNDVLAATPYGSGDLGDILIAQKAGDGLAISARDTQLGVVNRIIIVSPKDDTFATEMGLGTEVLDLDGNTGTTHDQIFISLATPSIKGLFIDGTTPGTGPALSAELTVSTTAGGIDGTLGFGFVEVTTTDGVFGTKNYEGTADAPITATLSLRNETTGETRFYINELMNGTSSNNISNLVPDFDFGGSFLARLDNIAVGGLGFSFPLGSNPEVAVWIPDITELTYNANPYDPATNNQGIFLTYPDLGSLQNFTSLSFTQIIKALNLIADNLSQLSAFSFLDEPLPFINVSVNDMIDYATKFADLIDAAAAGGSQSSLQDTLTELEDAIEELFNLDPSILMVSLDENGMPGVGFRSGGGVNGSSHASVTFNPRGDNNGLLIRSTKLATAANFNDATVRIVGDAAITTNAANASWDSANKVLTIKVSRKLTTANTVITAIAGIAGAPWTATLVTPDNPTSGNTGAGTFLATVLTTAGGVNGSANSSTIINPGGDDNALRIRTTTNTNAADFNNAVIRIVGDSAITGATATAVWENTTSTDTLTIKINPGVTTAQAIINALAGLAGTPWTGELVSADNATGGNTGLGTIRTVALQFSFVFDTAYANSLPLQLDLAEMLKNLAGDNATVRAFLDVATTLVQIEGSANMTVSASAALNLDFGLDLSNPSSVQPFFYDTTGVELLAKVLGTDIEIQASLGSVFGIWITDGKVTLDSDGDPETDAGDGDRGAQFRLGLKDNNGDGRHYFSETWFDFNNIDLRLEGGVSATLPIFAPFETEPLSGDSDDNGDGYPDNYLVIEIPDVVRLFLDEAVSTEATGLGKLVKFAGLHNDINIVSSTYSNYDIVFLDTLSGNNASASFNTTTNTLTVNITAGETTGAMVVDKINDLAQFATTALTADDDGTTTTTNTGAGKLEKISIITPDFGSLFDGLELCDVIANSIDEILDGLDLLLGSIQDGLNEIVYSIDFPLIGNGLQGAANFIGDFRDGLLRELREEVDAAGGNGLTAVENAIKKALWNSLGPGGLDLLVDFETGDPLDDAEGFSQLDVTLDCDEGLVVNVRLAKSIALLDTTQNPIDFEIGVPGFGLEVDGNVILSLGFDLKFGFGVDMENGFYFNSAAPASDPELSIYFRAEIPGLHAAGELLFLQLDVTDDAESPSFFEGAFEVDLMDPNGDGKLTFAELSSSGTQFDDIIHAVLGAEADINLDLAASFGGNTAFPRVLAKFHLGWVFDTDNGAGDPGIAFTDIYLDLGTFISDFLGPILEKIQEVTGPIQPIIDIVTARIPVISDLAGETITLIDLAEVFGLLEPSTIDFIEGIIHVIELINSLEGLGEGSILIPFGAFNLSADENGEMRDLSVLEDVASRTMDDIAAAAAAATGPGTSSSYSSATSGFVSDAGSLDNFSIPIFDNPAELFNLFLGEPVRLIEWRMPTFKFKFTYTQSIPIYPPLYAQFGGTIGADINIGFGYDTYGIQKYISSEDKNWVDILDGFYVLDFDANGNEQPELRLYGELFAGAEINLVIVKAGVRGGLGFELTFDLNDVNDDGKIRVSEIVANAQQDPRCIFDIEGRIYLFLEAFLKIDLFFFSIDKTWRFAEITLFSFEITCPEPVLASNSSGGTFTSGDLYLNIGSRAGDREEIDTNDNSETMIVKHVGGTAGDESVEVQWGNYKQTFDHVSKVFVEDAGQGDDYLDLRGVLSESEVHGGAGNDTIYLSDGSASSAYGDDGNDTITASVVENVTGVTLHGGNGNDTLTAGPTAITIYGDGGNDTITGSPEGDTLYGDDGTGTSTDGADTITAGDGDDTIHGGLGNDTIEGGADNDWIYGEGGNDVLRGSRGDDILLGGDDDDKLYGSSGNDLLVGNEGDDWANGHGGIDLLIGENFGTINTYALTAVNLGNIRSAIAAIPTAGITVRDLTGGDVENPNRITGNDLLIGGGNIDVLFGGPGNDFLYGGNFLNNGETEAIEEDANDFFDGGPDNDTIFGDDAMGRTGDRDTGIAIQSAIYFDLNKNGVKDADEVGFGGVTVTLYRNDDLLIGDTETESDGSFSFTGLDPDRYYLKFSSVAGLTFIVANPWVADSGAAELASNDSDINSSGQTMDFELTFDETEKSVAAGYEGDPLLSISSTSVTEGNTGQTNVTLTITLSGPQRTAVTVDYRTADGNDLAHPERNAVKATGDFLGVSGTLTFAAGELSKTITVAVLGDTTYEEHQQFRVILSNASTGIKLPTTPETTVLVTIINDDPIPSISIGDYVPPSTFDANHQRVYLVGEGAAATFMISLSNPSQYDITVWYLVDSDCGCVDADSEDAAEPFPLYADGDFFQPAPTMVTLKAGTLYKTITVNLLDDLAIPVDEEDETFYVDLYNPAYARIEDGRAYGIIPDDDPAVHVSIHKPGDPLAWYLTTMEGDTGYTTVDVVVELSKVSDRQVTVTYATAPGTAIEQAFSGDTDGDGVVDMLVVDAADYETSPLDTDPDNEFETLVFEPGETLKTITLKIWGDTRKEDNEIFFVNLLDATNADIAATPAVETNHVTIEILNDDALTVEDAGPWSVYFGGSAYEVWEPETGTAYAEITVHRTPGSSQAIAVFFTTNGSATAGSDYGAVFRQLVYFGQNEFSKTILIPIYSDSTSEADETVQLSLRNPTGGPVRASPSTATLTIHDEDVPVASVSAPFMGWYWDPVTFFLTPVYGVNEGDPPGTSTATFTVTLDKAAPTGGVTLNWETVSLSARAGTDFTGVAGGTVNIAAGGTTATFNVTILRDTTAELTEKFAVRLKSPVRATISEDNGVATCSIYDDEDYLIEGLVFYDRNGNGFVDLGENGIEDVDVTLTWMESGIHKTATVQTNSAGEYGTNVALGQVTISVDGTTVKSPFQKGSGLLAALFWSGAYETTTDNEVQTEAFDGITGISPFGPVGYKNSFSFTLPEEADDVGRGGTDDTIFGGPGDDTLDAGAGDDHVIGGHWQTATDTNMPVNQAAYDAVVIVVTDDTDLVAVYGLAPGTTLHSIYDEGPIFSVTPQSFAGVISGQIWTDNNQNGVQNLGDLPFTKGVLVTLLDCAGNPVNAVFTTTGAYSFTNLYVDPDNPTAASEYVIQFELPEDYAFVDSNVGDGDPNEDLTASDNDAEFVNRTREITITANTPTETGIDAGVASTNPALRMSGYQFTRGTYSVSEDTPGYIEITVRRGNSYTPGVVVIRTQDGTGANGALSSPNATRNFTDSVIVLVFNVGETMKSVQIPIFDRGLGFCDFRYFTVTLNDATGRPYDSAAVFIAGGGAGTVTDHDEILGGSDWDIVLGDSGNIPGYAVVAEYADISQREKLGDIVTFGGPGDDTIDADIGADYIDGQLGDDVLSGGDGVDIVIGGLGDDEITVGQGDDDIRGDHGYDAVISVRSVAGIVLVPTMLTHQTLENGLYSTLNDHILRDTFEVARLYGDAQPNRFDLNGWATNAFIAGGGGQDTLLVTSNTDMTLRDATWLERVFFSLLYGFSKDASLALPTDATYHLSSLENVTLTGGAGDNKIDASGYSRAVSFVGMAGNDMLIGGSAGDTFVFDGDNALGTDTVTGNGGADLLDFTQTSVAKVVIVDLAIHVSQPAVAGNVSLILVDDIENLSGGAGHDFLYGNALANVLLGGPGNDWLEGRAGNETYVFDTDSDRGDETVVENIADTGYDLLDFSGTTSLSITLNMGILGAYQDININLSLRLNGEGIEEVRGGALPDTIRGNGNDNLLRGGLGDDLLDGKSGDDVLDGGAGNDDLNGGEGGEVVGDTINETANTNFILTDTSLTRGTGEVDTLDNIEVANLTGGAGNNTFTLTGWSGDGSVTGGGGLDQVILALDADFTLTDLGANNVHLSLSTGQDIDLAQVEGATFTGGPSGNDLDASALTLNAAGLPRMSFTLIGGAGVDVLKGSFGNDTLMGGLDNDTLTGGRGNDVLDGGTGSDQLIEDLTTAGWPVAATWPVDFVVQNATLVIVQNDPTPTPTNDTITETDTLAGLEIVNITGSPQNDSFDVSGWTAGAVTVNGGGGTDTITVLVPVPDLDPPAGGTVTLSNTGVTFSGATGTISFSSIEMAILTGTDRNEELNALGFSGLAVLYGMGGDDVLKGGPGINYLYGGDGNDRFVYAMDGGGPGDGDLVEGDAGVDTLDFSAFAVSVAVNLSTIASLQTVAAGELQLWLAAADIENLIGGSGADTLTGNALDNRITGGAGADNINGLAGTDTIVETADANFTLTNASLTTGVVVDTLANIERAELTGGGGANTMDASAFSAGAVTLDGAAGNDTLIGGTLADVLIGGAGDDTLRGGTGNDTYRFDVDQALGADTVDEQPLAANGVDFLDFRETQTVGVTVDLSIVAQQTVHATNLRLTLTSGSSVEYLAGGDHNDTLTGNGLDNAFVGGLGADVINGGAGNNFLVETREEVVGHEDDNFTLVSTSAITASLTIGAEVDALTNMQTVWLTAGSGYNTLDASQFTGGSVSLTGGEGDDVLIGGYGDDNLTGGVGNDSLYGGAGDDFLYGGDGEDTLNGCGAIDPLLGADGNDWLEGGNDNDTYVFDQSFQQGSDTVTERYDEGALDILQGVGVSGVDIFLNLTGAQTISPNLTLTLNYPFAVDIGSVENAFP